MKFPFLKFLQKKEPPKPIRDQFMKPEDFDPKGFDPKKPIVTEIYKLIYQPGITAEMMEEKGIDRVGPKLYGYVAGIVKSALNYMRAIPIITNYFGKDFMTQISIDYNRGADRLQFLNLGMDEKSLQFTKEIALYIAKTFEEWLRRYHVYVCWMYEEIRFVTAVPADSRWHVDTDLMIIWYE